ncbi:VOC family protein [Streptomyces albidoflavus]|uniref:VOC family protein n=1 Tax=Streptomyces TaxID=1883 RepID=UPI00024943CC|nr:MULTISPECIES: VOC family protein [Streptomyces]MBV7649313.1 VOC family protein [Streptomyces albidoflavus]MBV7710777.1 VOC family protein [Streptomyces albidoflavus]MCU7707111.1 VOC family protein [Streptomyces albidoflavus]RZD77478.1 glyoxalase [Streptomyces albidoflavus]RZD78572.1 glyoxalase [Streptomyces albidoflavus]
MTRPNMFIVHVSHAPESARFYGDLFAMEPVFEAPRFIAFELGGGVQLALWSGGAEDLSGPRTSEVCLNLDGAPASVDARYEEWKAKGVTIVEEPQDAVFGRTFVAADPDGNLIRVAPFD